MGILRAFFLVAVAVFCTAAGASFHTFGIEEIFSNADGSIQFIQLKEASGANGQQFLQGHTLIVTQGATMHTLVFQRNLSSSGTANRSFLVATQGFADLGIVSPDYIVPAGFLPVGAASVNYAGVDTVAYMSLPVDGVSALDRSGALVPNQATNFAGVSGSVVSVGPAVVTVVEFYHQLLDHYFMTALASDIAALDGGVFAGWARTGETFNAYPTQQANTVPTCRFFIPPEHGSSHFFSARAEDCAFLLMAAADPTQFPSFSGYIQEDAAAFYVTLPDATGACPVNTVPVFRLWNQRFDSNHRYTTKQTIVAQMQARNYVLEGALPNQAAMCAPM